MADAKVQNYGSGMRKDELQLSQSATQAAQSGQWGVGGSKTAAET